MAGGSGERFWPLSRPERPKQLLKLTHETQTMLEEAVERIAPLLGHEQVYVSTSLALKTPIQDFGVLPKERVLAEPARRNTLGAIAWVVASLIAEGFEDATVAVLTSDHMIGAPEKFLGTVEAALETAERESALVTIGVTPSRPETGYGYIEFDQSQKSSTENGKQAFRSKSFREKPSHETAVRFVEAGTFLWNSGMFFFTIPTFLKELKKAQPEAFQTVEQITNALRNCNESAAVAAFEDLPNISVDYAVMERAERVFVLPSDFPWDDVGAWDALARTFELDEMRNVSQGNTILIDAEGCVVVNDDDGATVGVLGLHDVIVVNTRDAVLVCPKGRAQEVRRIVEAIKKRALEA